MEVVVRLIVPRGPAWWKVGSSESAISTPLDGVARNARSLLAGTTSDWTPPVVFTITGSGDERIVGTGDQRFIWVDLGTRGHVIAGKRGRRRMLAMVSGYKAKTSRGNLSRRGGGSSSGIVFRHRVYHPGIQARRLSERVQKLTQPLLESRIRAVMERLARGA